MRILNVAEKPSVARALAELLSGGTAKATSGENRFCKNYRFECQVEGRAAEMVFTSVLGHLYTMAFKRETRWAEIPPFQLFTDPVELVISAEMQSVSKNLLNASRGCGLLIIWTDCDREGENIGEQVSKLLCSQIQHVKRARFSGLGPYEIRHAIENLGILNHHESLAVLARFEVDLRIGAALTRLQTLGLSSVFSENKVVSYGSCQIPTLGFVCEREGAREEFVPEKKWTVEVEARCEDGDRGAREKAPNYMLAWNRGYIFEHEYVMLKYLQIQGHPLVVTRAETKPVVKYRPVPLRTVELQKFFARKTSPVRSSHELMAIAEKLYTSGYISYPRTETDAFSGDFNYKEPLRRLQSDAFLGEYARTLVPASPSKGKHSDQAHTPIYPIKDGNALSGKERSVYEYIARRFLACYSKNAEGIEQTVECTVNGEVFTRKALEVVRRNYLEVFIYEKWESQKALSVKKGDALPWSSEVKEGCTEQPSLLTEAELIAKMDANGIGTDATIHDHIQRIKERGYVRIVNGNQLESTWVGKGLICGYRELGLHVHEPSLRKEFEASLKKIERQETGVSEVLQAQITMYQHIYGCIDRDMKKFKEVFMRARDSECTEQGPGKGEGGEDSAPPKHTRSSVLAAPSYPHKHKPPLRAPSARSKATAGTSPARQRQWQQQPEEDLRTKKANKENAFKGTGSSLLPLCHCKVESKEQTVKKDGRNKGKQFYSCSGQQCDFFQWKLDHLGDAGGLQEDPARASALQYKHNHSSAQIKRAKSAPLCICSVPAQRLISKTQANSNRPFYKCARPQQPCTFFKWEDE